MSHATPHVSVGEFESFVGLLRTACEDPSVSRRLRPLLELPPERRRALLQGWVTELVERQAPPDFIRAIACLLDDEVAGKAADILFRQQQAQRRRGVVPQLFILLLLLVPTVLLLTMLGDTLLTMARLGLRDPLAVALPSSLPVLCVLTGFMGVTTLRLARWQRVGDRRWLLASVGASAALAAVGVVVAAFAPVSECRTAEAVFRAGDDRAAALAAIDACLAAPRLTSAARGNALRQRSVLRARAGRAPEALADLQAAFAAVPAAGFTDHWQLAARLREAGRQPESLQAAERAEALARTPGERLSARQQKAWTLVDLGRPQEALALLEGQADASAAMLRGHAWRKLGDEARAQAEWKACDEARAWSVSRSGGPRRPCEQRRFLAAME